MNQSSLSLPAWVYNNPEFSQLENDTIFKSGWQLACHISDIKEIGNYVTYKIGNESIVVVRNEKNELNAFYNVCRHRASRLLDGESGTCERRIKCPYHSWTYDYSGNLLGAPNIKEYPELDKKLNGLYPVEVEQHLGFVFIRLAPGGESVQDLMAPVYPEFSQYQTEKFEQHYETTEIDLPVNWKAAVDNFLDGIHVQFAHPGLNSLIGEEYTADMKGGVYRAEGPINYKADKNSDVKRYHEILPNVPNLSEELNKKWVYYFIWPNTAFCVYPDKIETMQFIPTGAESYKLRLRGYAMPSTDPAMLEAREIADRINFKTQEEDDELLLRIQEGMNTSTYSQGLLGQQEILLRAFIKQFRENLPLSMLTEAPEAGTMAAANDQQLKLSTQ